MHACASFGFHVHCMHYDLTIVCIYYPTVKPSQSVAVVNISITTDAKWSQPNCEFIDTCIEQ